MSSNTGMGAEARSPWPARIAAILVILVGAVLIVSTFTNDLFAVGSDFEEMIDDFRPMLQEEALATAQADVAGLGAVSEELSTQVIPALATQLGTTPEGLNALMQEQFPDVATGIQALPTIVPTFSALVVSLGDQAVLFASADAIPTDDLPATTVPWGILLAGIAAVAVGLFMLIKPGRASWFTALGLGVLLVVVPVVLSLVDKSNDADELNVNLEPIYTEETVAGAGQALAVVGAMGGQMQAEMLPGLAQQLGQTPEEFQAFLGSNFPALGAVLADLPSTLERFELFVGNFENNLDNYETVKPVDLSTIVWTIIIGGIVIIIVAGAILLIGRRRGGEAVPSEPEKKLVGSSA